MRICTISPCRVLSAIRAMLVCGLKSVEKLDHSNGKNPVYTIHYPDLTSGNTQWRIQDFPKRGAPTREGRQAIILKSCSQRVKAKAKLFIDVAYSLIFKIVLRSFSLSLTSNGPSFTPRKYMYN